MLTNSINCTEFISIMHKTKTPQPDYFQVGVFLFKSPSGELKISGANLVLISLLQMLEYQYISIL